MKKTIGILVVALLAGVFLLGCAGDDLERDEINQAILTGIDWELVSYGDSRGDLENVLLGTQYLFEFSNTEMNSVFDCNTGGGDVELDGTDLNISHIFFTEMACLLAGVPGYMDQQTQIVNNLDSAERFEFTDGTLRLLSPNFQVLEFKSSFLLCENPAEFIVLPEGYTNSVIVTFIEGVDKNDKAKEYADNHEDFSLLSVFEFTNGFSATLSDRTANILRCDQDVDVISLNQTVGIS